jgi:farnesol kinase
VFAPFLAPLIVIVNIIKVTVIGLGLVKDEGVINSMTRHGERRYILFFFLEYAKDLRIIVIKKKSLIIQTTRF